MSSNENFIDVGRPWLHWLEFGVISIFLKRAFISSIDKILPEEENKLLMAVQETETDDLYVPLRRSNENFNNNVFSFTEK